ncbi:class I SAM-dependent methyltransferase [Mesorhizobium sp. M7A.F.Ca.CA.001.07.2.1]|uniref:methyltransferase domain-containing protein n=1 Tax=Mesorhizobium TaxID=68287 RepID=UPI000FCC2347|nr:MULTISPECIES: class I SAM-dependent methyltransferase [Mesorhizobium]RVB44551.1 class I SAM-dependent methyltransferase [Mesorhizobium sp. M7A.F.Ca.CA.004.05.1.1]RWN86908.1 MAG: class I SAM-dependent methyltransferase [Mesorhizobium sp.]MCF6127906.1 methyltransferase domain-containing protein [Mesorhizobium ciceri]MCQ8818417.1 methyltransferase domain-containing protein [Mesorhizobium sp. SEMIA396]RUU82174.1 class I SAM-dependent methyltransferase [Mesorhizobium sp. M7A.F.Ca.MR.362.00.0.0]
MCDATNYDENWADVYEIYTTMQGKTGEADETAAFLERFSCGGIALELGIGNGRVAVPLSERGVKVEGIDNSGAMLKLLADRTDLIKAWKGSIVDFNSVKRYNLIYSVYGTLTLLLKREDQISCLKCAAQALDEAGALVIEVRVPILDGFLGGIKVTMTTTTVDSENTFVKAEAHDSLNQNLISNLFWFSGTSVRRLPERVRYVYHQELDSMAQCAGLELVERWGDWAGGAFTDRSKRHISVYRRMGL